MLIDYSNCLPEGDLQKRKLDVRLRNTNKKSEIILKSGSWGGSDVRKEYSVLSESPFDNLVQVYKLIGLDKGVLCIRNIDVFTYEGVEIALVEVPGHSYFFEAEIELSEVEGVEKAQKIILSVLEKLGLTVYTDTEYFEYIEILNKEANKIFDANIESEDYFKENFGI